MNSYRRRDSSARQADAMLASMVEEAITETLEPPELAREAAEPPSAEGFLLDAAAFLRTRPDAPELLQKLQEMLAPLSAAPVVPPAGPSEAEPTAEAGPVQQDG